MLQWQKELGNVNDLPSVRSTLLLFAAVALAGWLWLAGPQVPASQTERYERPGSMCQEHAGRPGWAAVCRAEARP